MSTNILVLYVGGTICTTISDHQMATHTDAARALVTLFGKQYPTLADHVTLEDGPFLGILSEDMTVEHYNRLAQQWLSLLPRLSHYRGIIVAHGTDTLAYTTSLMAVLLRGISLPVVFVSSHTPLLMTDGTPNPHANGVDNFAAAVDLITRGLPGGVYATYRNPADGVMYCHRGDQLRQCAIYDDNFYSRDMTPITPGLPSFPQQIVLPWERLPITALTQHPLTDCLLLVHPYVGQNYQRLGLDGVKAVLHTTYHSGTCCVGDPADKTPYSLLTLLDRCAHRQIPLYYAPCHADEEHTVYATVPLLRQYTAQGQSIRLCYGHTDETMWAKLLYGYSVGLSPQAMDELLAQ